MALHIVRIAVTGAILAGFSSTASAITVDLAASQDSTILSELGTNSNGTGGIFVGMTDHSSGFRRGLIRFDTSSIPSNSTVTNVSMTLSIWKNSHSITTSQKLHRLTASWGEGTSGGSGQGSPASANDATWTKRFFSGASWTTPGGDFNGTASATAISGGSTTVWNSTPQLVADVQAWVSTPANNFGWIVIGNESSNTTTLGYFSREIGTAGTNTPRLTVTYTPAAGVAEWKVY